MKNMFQITALVLFASALGLAAWHDRNPIIETIETVRVVPPEKVEAYVSLTKWQLDKMLSKYERDAHPSDILKFKTVVKSDGSEWRISSTHLVKGSDPCPLPQGRFYVVDSSSVDYSGDFKSCIEYADSYEEFHNYIVVSSE
jgi:hypothetical protein|tara:strand:- start:516 stop:941 length:426 start_codon:yes stop_codon:yes gene_type:complete